MIAKLIARTGKLAGQDFVLPDAARIGAGNDSEVRIRLDGVSRNHARMYRDGEVYWLEDAGSTNGTFLNGQRIQRERLRHLDVVTLGRNVDLIFVCKAGEAPATSTRPGVLNASFVWLDGPESNATVEVPRGELTIGRATSCNVIVDSAAVSKVHARIVRSADQVTIQDLGSANGTFVNGKRVVSVMVLTDKDRVGLAGVRNLQVRVERDPSSVPVTAPGESAAGVSSTVFDQEWKTRLVWSPEELQELAAVRQQVQASRAAAPAAAPAEAAKPKPAAAEKPAAAKPAGPPPPPPRAQKPAEPGAAPAVKAPPPVPPRAAAAGEAKGPPPLPPRAAKPEAAPAGEAKGPPPLPPRAARPEGAPAGEVKGPPPLPPRVPKLPAEAAPPPPVPPRNPPSTPQTFPAAAPAPGTGTSATDPAQPGSQPLIERPDVAGAAEPRIPRVAAPASAKAEPPAEASTRTDVPEPRTSQPPPDRRTGPHSAVPTLVRPLAPNEGKPIRAVRLAGPMGTFTLEAGTYTVGRSEKAEIRVDDREVSRAHAILIVSATSVSIEDQKSANGTFVNGVEVKTRTVLRHGDKVMFGSLEFTVNVEA